MPVAIIKVAPEEFALENLMALVGFGDARQVDLGGNAYRDRQGNQGRRCSEDFSGTGSPPGKPWEFLRGVTTRPCKNLES